MTNSTTMFAVSVSSDSNGKKTNQTIADTTNATYSMTPPFEIVLSPLRLVGAEAAIAPRLQKTDGASANGAPEICARQKLP